MVWHWYQRMTVCVTINMICDSLHADEIQYIHYLLRSLFFLNKGAAVHSCAVWKLAVPWGGRSFSLSTCILAKITRGSWTSWTIYGLSGCNSSWRTGIEMLQSPGIGDRERGDKPLTHSVLRWKMHHVWGKRGIETGVFKQSSLKTSGSASTCSVWPSAHGVQHVCSALEAGWLREDAVSRAAIHTNLCEHRSMR